MEAARLENRERNITFTTFHPGFIETDMTKQLKPRRAISAPECARLMIADVQRRRIESTVPFWPWILMKWLIHLVPDKYMKFFG